MAIPAITIAIRGAVGTASVMAGKAYVRINRWCCGFVSVHRLGLMAMLCKMLLAFAAILFGF